MRDFEGKCLISLKKQRFLLVKNLLMANVFLSMKMFLSCVTGKICSYALTGGGKMTYFHGK